MSEKSVGKTHLYIVAHESHYVVGRKKRCVKSQIITRCGSPGLVGIEIVVIGSEAIDLFSACTRLFAAQRRIAGHYAVDTPLHRCMHKKVDRAGMIAEHIVRRTAYYHTRTGVGERMDKIGLCAIERIVAYRGGTGIYIARRHTECKRKKYR